MSHVHCSSFIDYYWYTVLEYVYYIYLYISKQLVSFNSKNCIQIFKIFQIASPQSLLIILLKITRRKYISKYNALSYCYLQQKMRKYTWKKPQTLNQRNKESLQLKKIKINFTLNNFTQMQKMNSEWKKLNSMIQLQF